MRLIIIAAGLLLAACGGSDDSNKPDDDDPAGSAGAGGATPEPQTLPDPPAPGVRVSSGEHMLAPGEETTICVFLNLPTTETLYVTGMEQANNGFAHHFILFRAGSAFEPGVGECPGGLHITHPDVYPGTRDQGPFHMPPEVAMIFEPGQGMILQLHLLNITTEPQVAWLDMNLYGGDPALTWQRAGIVGGSDFDFQIPPRSVHTATQRCTVLGGGNLFALMSHSHARTQSFDIGIVSGGNTEMVYSSPDWESPDVAQFDPPRSISPGSAFEFSCTWQNDSDVTVTYGDSATDEMCIFFGFYYPSLTGMNPCIGL